MWSVPGVGARRPAALLCAAVAAGALGLSAARPHWNWDMIGYVAAARSLADGDAGVLQGFTYAEVERSVPPAVFAELAPAGGDSYRRAVRADPEAFREQLPFYRIRPLHNAAVLLLSRAGVGLGRATHLVPGIAVAAAIALLLPLAASALPPPLAAALPLLAVAFGALDVARLATPDGTALLGVVLAGLLYAAGRATPLFLLLPLLVAVRTDLVLLSLPLAAAAGAVARRPAAAALSGGVALALALAIPAHFGHPGWAVTFHHTFVAPLARPLSEPPALDAARYLRVLAGRCVDLAGDRAFLLYAAAALSLREIGRAARAASAAAALRTPAAALALACLAYVAAHFLLFPAADERFFTGPYLLGAFALLALRSAPAAAP